jgi:hypothetical protein
MAIEAERNHLGEKPRKRIYLEKKLKFEFLKKLKFSPIINFRAQKRPFNKIQNTIYGI